MPMNANMVTGGLLGLVIALLLIAHGVVDFGGVP